MPEIQFKGKEFVFNHHLTVPYRPLNIDLEKSIGDGNLNGNLIVQGDNLHALKALMPMYAGEIECVFIDPPYNTGNESWSYNDNVNGPIFKEWLSSNPINKEDMLRHDKWCCMIYPRLKLIKELLSSYGYIGVTIDDNELDNLLIIMDEIFGKENRLACAAWLSDPSGGKQKTALRTGHEYFVIYGGGDPNLRKEESVEVVLNLEDSRGAYAKGRELNKWGANSEQKDRPSMYFPITAPDGSVVHPVRNDGKLGCWRFGDKSSLIKNLMLDPGAAHWEMRPFDAGVSVDGKTERWMPYEKIRDIKKAFGWSTWLDNVATNADGTAVIKQIFGDKVFETPKPVELIEWFIGMSGNTDCTVLDSFAGSGTTGHAVLKLNSQDGGDRKFILVECESNIVNITSERVSRVISGYRFVGTCKEILHTESVSFSSLKKSAQILEHINSIENLELHRFDLIKKEIKNGVLTVVGEKKITDKVEGTGGGFTYCTLGEPIDIDKILTGENLPDYKSIGSWLFHTATGEALSVSAVKEKDFFLGESSTYYVWLIYKPDLNFLKERDSALTLDFAEKIAKKKGKKHLVFASAKYVPNKTLLPLGVQFAPLPFALYRVEK
jgi:adenine-specific DNA-methyltransferase